MKGIQDFFRTISSPRVRVIANVLVIGATTVAIATGGCSNSSTSTTPTPTPSASPSPTGTGPTATPTPMPQNFVSISNVPPTTDPTYGVITGYGLLAAVPTSSPVSTAAPSQVITLTQNQTVVFVNFDRTSPHTASLLGPANGMNWPATFTNNNGANGLPAGTAITFAEFSTGTIGVSAGEPVFSQVYSTGSVTGMFYFGDFFQYLANPPIRTVIIIQ